MNLSVNIKDVPWKRYANTAFKVLSDTKILGLIILNVLTIYGTAWETILKPNLEVMKSRDTEINRQKEALAEKQNLQRQYGNWEKQLKTLDTKMIPVSGNNSAKVMSVAAAAELVDLAHGKLRDETVLPSLAPPHDTRENITLVPVSNESIDILKPPGQPQQETTETKEETGPPNPGADATVIGGAATSMPVERFDYDLKVTGTYAALVDLLNELVIRKTLVKINKVSIGKLASAEAAQPDAKEYPDFPLKLEMTVSLSIFLYASNEPQSSSS